MNILSKDEWLRRYAAHMVKRADLSQVDASCAANAALENADDFSTPEEAAEEEMSCWTNDEGSTVD